MTFVRIPSTSLSSSKIIRIRSSSSSLLLSSSSSSSLSSTSLSSAPYLLLSGGSIQNNTNATIQSSFYHTKGAVSYAAAAAATKREKRGLTVEQHGISSSDATGTATTIGGSSATVPSTSGGSSSSTFPLVAIGGAIILGGGAYYYYNKNSNNTTTTIPNVPVSSSSSSSTKEIAAVVEATTKSTTNEEGRTTTTAGGGKDTAGHHRVVSIAVPNKMKNTSTSTSVSAVPSHPLDGNRVTTLIPKSLSSTSSEDSSSSSSVMTDTKKDWDKTDHALEELKSSIRKESVHELIQSYQHPLVATSSSSSSSLINIDTSNIENMTTAQLQFTIIQLQKELQERTKWEAIRLKEFLLLQEKDISNKYTEILQKQRLEYEDTIAKKLREREHEVSVLYNQQLQHKDATVQAVIQSAVDALNAEHESDKRQSEELLRQQIQTSLDEEYSTKMEEYKQRIQQDLQNKVAILDALQEKIQSLESSLEASKISREGSTKAHRLSAAALALTEVLETDQGARKELQALQFAAGKEGVISTAVSTIPESAVKDGVPTVAQLQSRFRTYVYKKCRQAALVPTGRYGVEGQIAGIVFAALKYAPDPNEPVDDETVLKSPEYIVERIHNLISTGNIEYAVDEIDKLPSNHQTTFVLQDWKRDAIHRIAIDKALKVIKMECALLNESCL